MKNVYVMGAELNLNTIDQKIYRGISQVLCKQLYNGLNVQIDFQLSAQLYDPLSFKLDVHLNTLLHRSIRIK